MTDTNKITNAEALGEIVIAPQVVETIVAVAAAKSDGVYGLRNKVLQTLIGKKQMAVAYMSTKKTTKLL